MSNLIDGNDSTENIYKLLMDNVSEVFWILDIESLTYRFLSPSVQKQRGYSAEELLHLDLSQTLTPESLKCIKDFLPERIKAFKEGDNTPLTFELTHIHKNGSVVYTETTIRFGLNPSTNRLEAYGSSKDITQTKKLEKSLNLEKHILHEILESTLAGYWDWNIPKNEEYLSPTFKKMFGYEDDELPNSPESWQNLIFPEDLQIVLVCFDAHVKSKGQVMFYKEVRYKHKDGSTVWLICSGKVIEWADDGSPIRMVGCHVDITEKKEIEEELARKTLLLNEAQGLAKVGGWKINLEKNTLLWSDEVYRISETPEGFVPNLDNAIKFYHPDSIEAITNAVNNLIEKGEPYDLKLKYVTYLGNIKWVRALGKALYKDNKVVKVFGGFQDITDLHYKEESLMEEKKKAETANIAKSQFLANMSHEIRTPMNGIMGFLQLLEMTNIDATQKDFINNIKNSTDTLLTVINDILDVSKIEAGKVELECIPFDIRATIEASILPFKSRMTEKRLSYNVCTRAEIPTFIKGDPTRLKQVLSNLINNAVKFTDKGNINIDVGIKSQTDNSISLLFKVSDTGMGIPENVLDDIFSPFTQADNSSTRRFGGTGLGLSICKNIVELMGGEITVSSKECEGSTFAFWAGFEQSENLGVKLTDYSILKGKRILLVDDHPMNRDIARMYLQELDCMVDECESATDALGKLVRSQGNCIYNLVLVDYQMPGMSGYDLASTLKAIPSTKDIPLVLITSVANQGDAQRAETGGFVSYLSKPYTKNELLDCIALVLNHENSDNIPFVTRHVVHEAKYNQRLKILLAEDNLTSVTLFTTLLQMKGFNCDVAIDGKEAVHAHMEKQYDLIFMDCNMPVIDGYEATRKIRAHEGDSKHTPIIAMTAYAMEGDEQKCKDAGMDEYITKPVNVNVVMEMIEKYALMK